jgi:hypothetical protein
MNYTSLIECHKQYKYSANIDFDINNEEKIEEYIPNKSSTELLSEFFYDACNSNGKHAKILYGSYGAGKSHLLTILAAILSKTNINTKAFSNFLSKLENYDDNFAKAIKLFKKKEKPFLVVSIRGDYDDFNKCVLSSVKKELTKRNIDINYDSYYDEATKLINTWESRNDSREALNTCCKKCEINLNQLKEQLLKLDKSGRQKFEKLFAQMTYGAKFNSEDGNLLDTLITINEEIKNVFQGIVFIFDEFGKYVEDYESSIKVKQVQDLAEYCDHSKYNNSIILVSHRQLSLYVEKYFSDQSEEWKKIEGRFSDVSISPRYNQSFLMISQVLQKTTKWPKFKTKFRNELEQLYNQAWGFNGFSLESEKINPFEDCYPLHPLTLYALEKLSNRIAQNNRTFFTYLVGDEENSLKKKLESFDLNEFHFVGVNDIYDYFEKSMESYKSKNANMVYQKSQFALSKVKENTIDEKILKVIAVAEIISDSNTFKSDEKTISYVIDSEKGKIKEALCRLENNKIIRYMRQYNSYDFWNSSTYDIDEMIEENKGQIQDDQIVSILNDEFVNFALYPYEYNAKFHIKRAYIPVFANKEDIKKRIFLRRLPNYFDGALVMALDIGKEYDIILENEYPENYIFLTNPYKDLYNEVKRYVALKYLQSKLPELKENDPLIEKELNIYLDEEQAMIWDMIYRWSKLQTKGITVINSNKKIKCDSQEELINLASKQMYAMFPKTLIVNNDLINKNNITGAMRVARNKALTYLLETNNPISKCQKLSPEHTILRSVLSMNALIADETITKVNSFDDGKPSSYYIRIEIEEFLLKCVKAPGKVSELYKKLKQPPYGLRDGYIPVVFASFINAYQNKTFLFHGQEKEFTPEEISTAFSEKSDYELAITKLNNEQDDYINSLEKLFENYNTGKSKNRLKNLYDSMDKHYSSLSKSARTTERFLSNNGKKYRKIFSEIYSNYSQFFFDILPSIEKDLNKLTKIIKNIKNELESVSQKQIDMVINTISNLVEEENNATLKDKLKNKYVKEWQKLSNKTLDYQTDEFLLVCQNIDDYKTDFELIDALSNKIVGFEAEYWNDEKINEFCNEIEKILFKLDKEKIKKDDEIRVVIETNNDKFEIKRFNKVELSVAGKILFSKIESTMLNFGQSISSEEEMNILIELMKNIK